MQIKFRVINSKIPAVALRLRKESGVAVGEKKKGGAGMTVYCLLHIRYLFEM